MSDGILQKKAIRSMNLILFFSFIIIICCITISAADNVVTEVEIEYNDGVHLNINTLINVNELTLPANGVTYTKSEIQTISENNPEMMGAIKISVKGLFSDQLHHSFPNSKIVSMQELPSYSEGVFEDSYSISLLPPFFSLNETVDISSLVNGFLDCGAYVNYTFPLKSNAGWNQSFTFSLFDPLSYKRTNGDVDQNQIVWVIKTTQTDVEKEAEISLLNTHPTTPYSNNESIHVQFMLNFSNTEQPSLLIQFKGYKIAIDLYSFLPDFISHVKTLPADGVRLSILQNLVSWDTVRNLTFNPAYDHVKPIIENSSFNQSISSMFSWVNTTTISIDNAFNISSMNETPPITANYEDSSIIFTICNISSRAFFGLINAGAQSDITEKNIIIGDNLENIKYAYSGVLQFPNHILLEKQNRYSWDKDTPIEGSFVSTNAPEYKENDISTEIEIHVESTDLNLLSIFTGKTDLSIGLVLKETQKRNVTEIPFHFQLPKRVQLQHLNSDAFRICVEEEVFTNEQIQQFTAFQKELFNNRIKLLFPLIKGDPTFDQSTFEKSLHWDKNISSMDETSPILLSNTMQTTFPLMFDFSIIPPKIYIHTLNLSFSGIAGQDVIYSMVFPKGISIDVSDDLNRATIQRLSTGEMRFTLPFNATEGGMIDYVLITMQPSGLYILGMFVPCIVSIFITIILLFLIFIIRKKRKTMPPRHSEKPPSDYDQEDYYVPPPPPSKRKK